MSLESILSHIRNHSHAQAEGVIKEAKKEAAGIIEQAKKEAVKIYQELLDKEKALYTKEKQKLIVQARLEARKELLGVKQELIEDVFKQLKNELGRARIKKQQVGQEKTQEVSEDTDFYLKKIRPDYEPEIAGVLFK